MISKTISRLNTHWPNEYMIVKQYVKGETYNKLAVRITWPNDYSINNIETRVIRLNHIVHHLFDVPLSHL